MKKKIESKPKKQINTRIDFEITSPKKKKALIVLAISLFLFIVVFPSFKLMTTKSNMKTQIAVQQTIYKTIDVEAFAVRQENCLVNTSTGTIVPAVSNGEKISVGDTVADIFSSENSAANSSRINELRNEIDYYTGIASGSVGTLQTDIAVYKSSVNNAIYELVSAVDENELSSVYELSRSVREAVTKKQIVTGVKVDVTGILDKLTAEYNLLKSDSIPDAGIIADTAGHYSNTVDGYETRVDYDSVLDMTWDEAQELLTSSPPAAPSNAIGKIITEFKWYLVCNTTIDELEEKSVGEYVTVIFGNSQVEQIIMHIDRINAVEGTDKITLILSSNMMNEDIAELRKVPVKIRVGSISGLAVDKMALRTVDERKGVYVRVGNLVDFKQIDILYSDDTIVLVKTSEDSDYLSLYDEVILEGTGLYEAKLLN